MLRILEARVRAYEISLPDQGFMENANTLAGECCLNNNNHCSAFYEYSIKRLNTKDKINVTMDRTNEVLLHFISLLIYQEAPWRSPRSGETNSPRRLASLAYSLEETLKNQDSDDNTNRCKTIDFNEQNNAFWYISSPFSTTTQREMTNLKVLRRLLGLFFVFKSP